VTSRDDERPPPPRRRFLQRLLATGGSMAAVSLAGPLVTETSAGTAPTTDGQPPRPDEHLPDLSQGADSAAIQASIDAAAAAGGGTVVLPAGAYRLTDDLRLPDHVTLRGMSWSGTRLESSDGSPRAIVVIDGAQGASIESLTAPAVRFGASASFCVLRRLRLLDAPDDAVVLPTAVAHHLSLEQVTIESCGGDGIRHAAPDAQGVFLSEVAVTGFGLAREGARGLRLAGRAHVSQIHVETVGPGQAGVGFEAGSDYSTLTNYTMRVDGGQAVVIEPDDLAVAVGVGAVG
jgi:hypothetical protein